MHKTKSEIRIIYILNILMKSKLDPIFAPNFLPIVSAVLYLCSVILSSLHNQWVQHVCLQVSLIAIEPCDSEQEFQV